MAKHTVNSYSDIGIHRQRNEDSILQVELEIETIEGSKTDVTVMLLCDGMGGLNAGDWASQKACQIVLEVIENKQYANISSLIKKLKSSVYIVNDFIYRESKNHASSIGTTFTMLVISEGTGHIIHVGDSRIYEIDPHQVTREVAQQTTAVLTEDQSVVMQKVRSGQMTLEEAHNSPKQNLLYMCLGVFPSNKLDIFETSFRLRPTASYLICSDGFWHQPTDQQLLDIATGQLQLQTMVDLIKQTQTEKDNISAMIYQPLV